MAENTSITFTATSAIEDAKMLISKAAADARSDKGTSLYDELIPYSRDDAALEGILDSGMNNILTRLADVLAVSLTTGTYTVTLNIPDAAFSLDAIKVEIVRYLALFVAAMWLDAKGQAMGKDYATQAAASIERIVVLVKTRKAPTRVSS